MENIELGVKEQLDIGKRLSLYYQSMSYIDENSTDWHHLKLFEIYKYYGDKKKVYDKMFGYINRDYNSNLKLAGFINYELRKIFLNKNYPLQENYFIDTSYFGKINKLDRNRVVSIACKSPEWYKGKCMKQLAPTYNTWYNYKLDKSEERYIKYFYKFTLNKLNPEQIATELNNKIILCYEKLGFCHRHLVIKWLKENGLNIESREL